MLWCAIEPILGEVVSLIFRFSLVVLLLAIGQVPVFAAEKPAGSVSEGFRMTGMQRDTVAKETEAMKFKGLRRETATRVLKETSKQNN